jgi:large-conductance mechanosensitive channel
VVQTFEKLQARRATGEEEAPEPLTVSEELLAEIRDLLKARG